MVFRLKGKSKDLSNVLPLMAGRGAVITAGIQGDPEEFYKRCEVYFRGFITEPLHLAFPFYFPLFDGSTIPALSADLTNQLLGSVQYYLRESMEDGGLLLLTKSAIDPLFKELNWTVEHQVRS
jgi:hypothetical protein